MTHPETIGRYEVVGRLAAGGMAEIFLARLRGPGGFRRPVVIKRVFPHLGREPEFRAMFADEARIIAELRHVNVVHVHELGLEEGELYLVMEYLAGESVSGLLRRLAEEGERIEPALACHVVAEVCAGLHAAHELRGPDGEPLHVVHRDVSPQNVIVTYEGDVKVIDFGIAKAADRLARTRTGHVKGKLGYMSPEQCRREGLDRTTDVFALGVVLHELITGRRLFKGDNDLALARAICDEPIPTPSEIWPECPAGVDAVVMRALEREPVDRYASAAAMRGALIALARELAPHLERRDALRGLMQRLFADHIEDKDAMVRATGALPAVTGDELTADEGPGAMPRTRVDTPRGRRDAETDAPRGSGRAIAVVAGVLALVGVGAWGLRSPAGRASEPTTPQTATQTAPQTAPVAAPPPASPSAKPAETEPTGAQAVVTVQVSSDPPGAAVRVDDQPRGETPLALELPRSDTAVLIRLERAGHRSETRSVTPSSDGRVHVDLERQSRRREPTPNGGAMDGMGRDGMGRDFFYFD